MPDGGGEIRHRPRIHGLFGCLGTGARLFGPYQKDVRDALDIRLADLEPPFDRFSADFDARYPIRVIVAAINLRYNQVEPKYLSGQASHLSKDSRIWMIKSTRL